VQWLEKRDQFDPMLHQGGGVAMPAFRTRIVDMLPYKTNKKAQVEILMRSMLADW